MVRRAIAGVIPAGHPALGRLWSSRQIQSRPFGHMRELIATLHAVLPGVLEDPQFLDRSVLVDGVMPGSSARDLSESFALLDVEGAVLVRDCQTGFRVGLVVFSDAAQSLTATRLAPRPGFYATCMPASSHGDRLSFILGALDDEDRRRPTAQLFRSLVPAQYLLDDESSDFHLRCVFITAVAGMRTAGGAYGLCRVAGEVLLARGYICAVIAWSDGGAGLLVYDDTETTELLSRRAPRLLHQFGLQMHESSLFPMPADPADREASLLLRLLPPYISEERYTGRVLLLRDLDTRYADAAEITYAVQHRLDLIYEGHEVEAVIIHRSQGVVVVVLGSLEDMEIVLQEPPETWLLAFGQQSAWVSVCVLGCPAPSETSGMRTPPLQLSQREFAPEVLEYARELYTRELDRCEDDDIRGIVGCFIGLCALGQPDAVLREDFCDRALLLSGIDLDTSWSHLWSALSTFGVLDDLLLDTKRRVALAVFSSWTGAARLLRELVESWMCMRFDGCGRALGAEDAAITAHQAHLTLSVIQGLGPSFLI